MLCLDAKIMQYTSTQHKVALEFNPPFLSVSWQWKFEIGTTCAYVFSIFLLLVQLSFLFCFFCFLLFFSRKFVLPFGELKMNVYKTLYLSRTRVRICGNNSLPKPRTKFDERAFSQTVGVCFLRQTCAHIRDTVVPVNFRKLFKTHFLAQLR